jgi:hypothetical protein
MSSWKNESVEYRNRLCERYGVIEEKFDKQAFNEDPIAYFESINYELHGTEWISAMWNLLKLAKTDSSLVKKQLGPNGQKVAQILKKIVDKNPTLKALVTEKQKSMTPEIEASSDKILMAEGSSLLKKYDRLLDGNVLNEGFKDWWGKKSTKAKVLIIAGIIAAILIIAGIIYYVTTKDSAGAQAMTQTASSVVGNASQTAQEVSEVATKALSNKEVSLTGKLAYYILKNPELKSQWVQKAGAEASNTQSLTQYILNMCKQGWNIVKYATDIGMNV